MKRFECSVLVILLAVCPFADMPAEEDPELDGTPLGTAIDRVLVYSDQAVVTRKAGPVLKNASERFLVEGLPSGLRDDSVRIKLGGAAEPKMVSLEVIRIQKRVYRKEEAKEAAEALKNLNRQAKALTDRMAELDRQSQFYNSLSIGKLPPGQNRQPDPSPLQIKSWQNLLQTVTTGLQDFSNQKLKLQEEIDDNESELNVAKARAERLLSYKTESSKTVALEVQGTQGQAAEIELSYRIHGPQWFPRYSVRADLAGKKVEIVMDALVRQSTGEDWSNVRLEFSAAEPSQSADLPKLVAWHISPTGADRGVQIARGRANINYSGRLAQTEGVQIQTNQQQTLTVNAPEPELSQSIALPSSVSQLEMQLKQSKTSFSSKLSRNKKTAGRYMEYAKKRGKSRAVQTEEKLKKVQKLWRMQRDALNRGAYLDNRGFNTMIVQKYGKDKDIQLALGDILAEARSNVIRADRLIEAQQLADGVVRPVDSSRGYDYKYRASRQESVPSDGVFSKVSIGMETSEAEFFYEVVAELSAYAYLVAELKNPFRSPVLSGPTGIFLGNDFVSQGNLPTTSTGEKLKIGLGVDEGIAVSRSVETKRDTVGWRGNRYSYRYTVSTKLRNNKKNPIDVVVIDRFPFSTTKDIVIKADRFIPSPDYSDKSGFRKWRQKLPPGGERLISFSYVVTHPDTIRVVSRDDDAEGGK